MLKENTDFIILSSIDWNTQKQVVHELTEYLSQNNNRVLFVENTGVRSLSFKKDFRRIIYRIKSLFASSKGFTKISNNITKFSPLFFPFFTYSKFSLKLNSLLISNLIMYWLRYRKFSSPVIISFLSTPLAQQLVKNINPRANIFYFIDNMAESSPAAVKLKNWENIFLKNSDLVMCTSKKILEISKVFNKNAIYAPSGVSFDKFQDVLENDTIIKPLDLPKKGKIIGFIGGIRNILDKKIILKICDEFTENNVVLIGPIYDNFKIEERKNLFIIGSKNHDEIPRYLKWFDIGLIPYIKNNFTDCIYPTKINEYLSMNIPVVSSNISEVVNFNKDHSNVVKVCNTDNDFIKEIHFLMNRNKTTINKKFLDVAKSNSWKKRFEFMSFNLEKIIFEKENSKNTWDNYINNYVKNTKLKFYKLLGILTLSLLIVFKSPLVPYLENTLSDHDNISNYKADALVIFSGHGSSEYFNFDYRKRYIDVKFYAKKYPNKRIFIYGRSNYLDDSEVIKTLLVSNEKINSDLITTIEKKMSNTFENINLLQEILLKQDIKNILFFTAPIHSKRVRLIWNKNVKGINLNIAKSKEISDDKIEWGASIEQIKNVIYEFSAILYNYLRGWI